MIRIPLILLTLLLSLGSVFAQEKEVGTPLVLTQIQVVPIEDTQADRQYELYIELPEGYSASSDKQYPVLYYTDAMWHVEILSACADYILSDAILVGISWQKDLDLTEEQGAHVSRYRDYTIVASANPEHQIKYQFGNAKQHLDFIRQDVIPFVEARYRTDPNNRAYFGYSLGGVFGAYVLLSQPETFKHYLLGSPSLKGDIPILTEMASNLKIQKLNANVFISYGTMEEELGGCADQFIRLLEARNLQKLSVNHFKIKGNHQTAFPGTGVQSITWLSGLLGE